MILRDIGQQNAAALYAGLSKDLEAAATKAGATEEFAAANSETKRLYDIAQGPVSKIVASKSRDLANDPKPEEAAASLLAGGRKGDTDLAALKAESFPVGELASAALRDPAKAEKWMTGLSPEARETLLGGEAPNLEGAFKERADAASRTQAVTDAANAKHSLDVAQAKALASRRPDVLGARSAAVVASQKAEIENAKSALAEAQSRIPPPGSDQFLIDRLHAFKVSPLGWALGGLAGLAFHGINSGIPHDLASIGESASSALAGGLEGHMAARTLESAYRGLKGASKRPGVVGAAALGAQAESSQSP
jgi:hypothetical protein